MTTAKLADADSPREFWRHPSGALVAPGDRWRGKTNDRDVRVQSIWVDTTPASTRIRIAIRSVASDRLSYVDANSFIYRFALVERPGAIVPAASERDAMAAENARLRDQNARLVALLEERNRTFCPVVEHPEGLKVDECSWEAPWCWTHRKRALLAEIKAGA